jgi:hypothetical protein
MTVSNVIALVVAAILVLGFCYLVLRIVIRGGVEISGYRADWRTNPVFMTIWLLLLVPCPVIIVWGTVTYWPSGTHVSEVEYRIYLEVHAKERPHLRYEGTGIQRALKITEDDAGQFQIVFSAMTLPPGIAWELDGLNDLREYLVFDFVCGLSISKGKFRLKGELQSRERGELVVVGSEVRIVLHPGKNPIAGEWNLLP